MGNSISEVSVFVDESGSFDSQRSPSRYYLVTLVFHDQSKSVESAIVDLENALEMLGMPRDHCVHAGPLVRREQAYSNMTREERRRVFSAMMAFVRKIDISYRCFRVDKKFVSDLSGIHDAILQQFLKFLVNNMAAFDAYGRLKIYYDNGQPQIKGLLKEAFALFASRTEFVESVCPSKYRLFQVADMFCTLELMQMKLETERHLSDSEMAFFNGLQNLRKNYLKPMAKKRWIEQP